MIVPTVLICLLLVSSAASQERFNVIVLQSNRSGAQCPPADQLDAVRNNITENIRTLIRNNVLAPGSFQNPATSCVNLPQGSPSGSYWIQNPTTGNATLQYCDNSTRCSCSAGGWMRVANLDMTDQNQQCPSGFRNVAFPRRSCGRPSSTTCVSTTFPVNGVEYSRVCGRIIGYQYGSPNAFRDGPNPRVIDDLYVEGVSLTHGSSPRKHIWTFAAALHEGTSHVTSTCQCTRTDTDTTGAVTVPPFIGEDYFCETGSRNVYTPQRFYEDDPLWDGQGCGAISTCCSFNNPPWFCKQLPQPTSDDIEIRLCGNGGSSGEDTPIEVVEIYVK